MKSPLGVFARIKPYKNSKSGQLNYKLDDKSKMIQLSLTKNSKYGHHINNNKDTMDFAFTGVLDQNINQEEVFDLVAKPVVLNCLEGYNGTIFAYGQTGSGKTFTMSGSESWQQRGIIPRVLSFVFDEIERRIDMEYKMSVSYMEIYNEQAYDLLDQRHSDQPIENWNKIIIFEDDFGAINLKNITTHLCKNEQEGIDLLMMGNFIKQVSSTSMNQCSSRSHCVFTITLEGKQKVSEVGFVSKLHLVDLAGSERISKTQAEGNTLNEAKHINLSLTYLEQVIVALHERNQGNRQHVPYRNSVMTTLLKDSLGGNCKTVMIATFSSDVDNLDETISTARFAQRCSQLENEISKNEKVDLNALVIRLEKDKAELEKELQLYRDGGQNIKKNNKFPEEKFNGDYNDVLNRVDSYLNEKNDDLIANSPAEAQVYFRAMKDIYNTRMKEYVTELTFISEKLQKYDEILSRKKSEKQKVQKENKVNEASINYGSYKNLEDVTSNKINEGRYYEENNSREEENDNMKYRIDRNKPSFLKKNAYNA